MSNKQRRVIKLHSKYRQAAGHGTNGAKILPWLNVHGVWLEQAGFKTGHQVEIIVANNQLVITNLAADGNR